MTYTVEFDRYANRSAKRQPGPCLVHKVRRVRGLGPNGFAASVTDGRMEATVEAADENEARAVVRDLWPRAGIKAVRPTAEAAGGEG